MNMYEATKAAAAHIAAHPELYSFQITDIPNDERPRGCILGRIAQIVGYKTTHANYVSELLGVGHIEFFGRVLRLMAPECAPWGQSALDHAAYVAPALARYAELYRRELEAREYPPGSIPKAVREIFNPQVFGGLFLGAGGGGGMSTGAHAQPATGSVTGVYCIALDEYIKA